MIGQISTRNNKQLSWVPNNWGQGAGQIGFRPVGGILDLPTQSGARMNRKHWKWTFSDRVLFSKKELAKNIIRASSTMRLNLTTHYGFGSKIMKFHNFEPKSTKNKGNHWFSFVFQCFCSKSMIFWTKTIARGQI